MLLELLSDFQISIPELGRIEARTHPVVLLTSNNSRELTEALKRRCLYLWLDYPTPEHELAIVKLHTPELPEAVAQRLVEVDRDGARARPQEAAVDRRVDRLGARAAAARRRRHLARAVRARRCRSSSSTAPTSTPSPSASGSSSAPPRRDRAGVHAAGRSSSPTRCAREGVAIGTSEILDSLAALEQVAWTEPEPFREALAATLAKSPEDRRIFELIFERFFFRAAEAEALRRGVREGHGRARRGRHHRRRADRLRQPARADPARDPGPATSPRCATWRGSRSPRSGAAARARACSASTCSGSAARWACAREPGGPAGRRRADRRPDARPDPPLRGRPAARARARADRAHAVAAAGAGADRARPRAAHRAAAGPRRRAPRRHAAQAPAGDAGPRDARAQAPRARRRAAHDARLAGDRRRARRPEVPARAARAGPSSTCSATSRPASPRPRSSSCRCCTRCTTRSARCARSCSSSGSPRSPTSSSASARSRRSPRRSRATPASPTSRGYTDYGRVWSEFLTQVEDDLHPRATVIVLGDARTNGRDPRADLFAARRRARRPHVLAQPRAEALLELRRLGRRRLRAVLLAPRVLDDAPARGLRQGPDAAQLRVSAAPAAPAQPRRRPPRRRPRRARVALGAGLVAPRTMHAPAEARCLDAPAARRRAVGDRRLRLLGGRDVAALPSRRRAAPDRPVRPHPGALRAGAAATAAAPRRAVGRAARRRPDVAWSGTSSAASDTGRGRSDAGRPRRRRRRRTARRCELDWRSAPDVAPAARGLDAPRGSLARCRARRLDRARGAHRVRRPAPARAARRGEPLERAELAARAGSTPSARRGRDRAPTRRAAASSPPSLDATSTASGALRSTDGRRCDRARPRRIGSTVELRAAGRRVLRPAGRPRRATAARSPATSTLSCALRQPGGLGGTPG